MNDKLGFATMFIARRAAFFYSRGEKCGLTVIKDSGGVGGELTLMIGGDVSGAITVPVLKSLLIGGDLSANITVTDKMKGGTLDVDGSVTSAVMIDIADMVSDGGSGSNLNFGTVDSPGLEFAGDLLLETGLKVDQVLNIDVPLTSTATIDFSGANIASYVILAGGDGDIINGGAVTNATFWLVGSGNEPYSGTATFQSIALGASVRVEAGTLDGEIHVLSDLDGDIGLQGGDLLLGGRITVDGNVSGFILIGAGAGFNGDADGTVKIGANLYGSIDVGGDARGDLDIVGDITGSVIVNGALANASLTGGGRILVGGESSGAIKIGESTGSLTLIQVAGGLATGATIEINTTRGAFSATGDIHIGGTTPTPLLFDGCIRIYDDGVGGDGHLKGDLAIVMCHDNWEVLNICIDGDDAGNVDLDQTGCTYQTATWSCGGCP